MSCSSPRNRAILIVRIESTRFHHRERGTFLQLTALILYIIIQSLHVLQCCCQSRQVAISRLVRFIFLKLATKSIQVRLKRRLAGLFDLADGRLHLPLKLNVLVISEVNGLPSRLHIAVAFSFINSLEVSEWSLSLVQSEDGLARILAPGIDATFRELVAWSILQIGEEWRLRQTAVSIGGPVSQF